MGGKRFQVIDESWNYNAIRSYLKNKMDGLVQIMNIHFNDPVYIIHFRGGFYDLHDDREIQKLIISIVKDDRGRNVLENGKMVYKYVHFVPPGNTITYYSTDLEDFLKRIASLNGVKLVS